MLQHIRPLARLLALIALVSGTASAQWPPLVSEQDPVQVLVRPWVDGVAGPLTASVNLADPRDTFEIVVRAPAGCWCSVQLTAFLDENTLEPSFLAAAHAAYPWLEPDQTDLPGRWPTTAFEPSHSELFGDVVEVETAALDAVGLGPFPVADAVRHVYQPVLVDTAGTAVDRTWDVGCQSWSSYPDPLGGGVQELWKGRLAALDPASGATSVSNTTQLSARLSTCSALEQLAPSKEDFEAFMKDPLHGMTAIAAAGGAFALAIQVLAAVPQVGPMPAVTDNDTGGLTGSATGELLPLLLALSGGATVTFYVGVPSTAGGPGYVLNGIALAPTAMPGELRLTVDGAILPMRAKVSFNGTLRNVYGTYEDPRTIRFAIPQLAVGSLIEVLEIENPWGVRSTAGTPWSQVMVASSGPILFP